MSKKSKMWIAQTMENDFTDKILITEDSFQPAYDGCIDYALNSSVNKLELGDYMGELEMVMKAKTIMDKWDELLGTGVFHDTYGKIIDEGTEKDGTEFVIVTTDY